MLHRIMDTAVKPVAWAIEYEDMKPLGQRAGMRLARGYNRLKFGRDQSYRARLYAERFDELLRENGPPSRPTARMEDGWAIDESGSFPHLDEVLRDGEEIIRERAGKPRENWGKPYLQDLFTAADAERYPSFLKFITSSEVLKPVCDYLGFVPCLSRSTPPAIRLMESNDALDAQRHLGPRASQMFHLDYHDGPMVYVVVALRDITEQSGPFCFLGISDSERAAAPMNYRSRGSPYRVTDEAMYAVMDPSRVKRFTCRAGSVLFIDSGRCFHYGSRDAVVPRYQLMYSFVSACRSDFTEVLRPQRTYHLNGGAPVSRLKQLVLDKRLRL